MNEAEWLASEDPAAMLKHLHGKASDRRLRLFACACCRQAWDGTPCPHCKGTLKDPGDLSRHASCPACRGSGRVNAMTDPRSLWAVEVAERYADGEATAEEMDEADRAATIPGDGPHDMALFVADLNHPAWLPLTLTETERYGLTPAAEAALLRDVFGNPWSPVLRIPADCGEYFHHDRHVIFKESWLAWNDGVVRKLAASIYADRRFAALPVLADALEEAGCTDAAILNHCRGRCDFPGCLGGWVIRTDGRLGADPCRRCRDAPGKPISPVRVRGDWVVDLLLGKE